MTRSFIKMHGLGNDFVIFDARHEPFILNADQARLIADRKFGIGCDQVIVMEPSTKADTFMRIYNADGSQSASCGNATRCVAWLLMQKEVPTAQVETLAGVFICDWSGGSLVTVDMGAPIFDWQKIPLSHEVDVMALPINFPSPRRGEGRGEGATSTESLTPPHPNLLPDGEKGLPIALSMGNPHAVFVVPDVSAINLEAIGPELEHHPLFPERANIGFVQVISRARIKLRVWERGAGATLACGTAACAALVACASKNLTDRHAYVELPGGELEIDWDEESNSVCMTGPVAISFNGSVNI